MSLKVREEKLREFWEFLQQFPELVSKGQSLEGLITSDLFLLRAEGDVSYELSTDNEGVFTLLRSDRGQGGPIFVTNSVRALVVQLAYRVLSGRADLDLGHSPYEEAPFTFTFEERRVLNEYENECVVVRWFWGNSFWAEVVGAYSLLEGLTWAWVFTSSDQTIRNCLADRDGRPLFGQVPGPRYDRPPGAVQQLSVEQWNAWRESRLEGKQDG
ncbi:hypothetical protein [Leucobacter denitrificans]|uniref:Uncharacterized protein n=1 Tax=Leucobacter denitrificans TaxID=683042 RepID=A0A7G9S4E0_9MICO|nr:hypothetical protein [Leucobacter denitrificans]QNN62715.1 hypothetical protein H9L06_10915 [Leucobacter denitrificans]